MQKKAVRGTRRALAFLLCLLMVATLLPAMGANAANGGNEVGKDGASVAPDGLVLDKYLTEDASGNYTLTLEAYATGTTTTVTEQSGRPLDIVLVLDQSGSMSDSGYVQPLKNAVTAFVNSISANAREYEVDHRIALVGYASRYDSTSKWANTGLFINGSLYNYQRTGSSTQGSRLTAQNYKDALVSVNDVNGKVAASITSAIGSINGNGATYTNYGMEMANGVFQNNPIESASNRKRIVVVFTDGEPGRSGYDSSIATAAIKEAYDTKNTYNATVYTVGLYKSASDNVTTFMNYLSSNYPKARSMTDNGVQPVTEYVPVASPNSRGEYYYLNNGNYAPVYYCAGQLFGHSAGWYTEPHAIGSHNGTRLDPNRTQFYAKQTTTPPVASKYYMTTGNSAELGKIFETITQDIQNPSTDVTLNANAELRDTISELFDVKEDSIITVQTVAGTYQSDSAPAWGTTTQVSQGSFSGKNIGVTGFDYSNEYIAESHPGKKLVVTVTGLIPKDGGEKLFSNNDGAGIYESVSATTPTAMFPKPWTKVPVFTKVLDFSMTANIATSVQQTNAATDNYGAFTKTGDAFTYRLSNRVANGSLVFDGVDSALFYGNYNDDGADTTARWNKINVIPANNVYFDDDLLNTSSDFTDGDYGYDANVPTGGNTETVADGTARTFTFKGTGIDVYCTTEASSGWISAVLLDENGNRATYPTGETVKAIYMNNQYETVPALSNVPTISFSGLGYAKYQLVIETMNDTNYKLDGVRVYNPAGGAQDANYGDEAGAVFTQVRKMLLAEDSFTDGYSDSAIGTVYTDQVRDGEGHSTNAIETYEKVGPKNEVYLDNGNGVAFKVDPNATKVMIGLSAPEAGNGKVTVTSGADARELEIKSQTDMYYPVTPTADGYVYIKNSNDALIAVTNVKVVGAAEGASLLSVDEGLARYIADFDSLAVVQPEPDAPDTPDEPDTPNNSVSAIVQAIWQQVKAGIGKLFGRI